MVECFQHLKINEPLYWFNYIALNIETWSTYQFVVLWSSELRHVRSVTRANCGHEALNDIGVLRQRQNVDWVGVVVIRMRDYADLDVGYHSEQLVADLFYVLLDYIYVGVHRSGRVKCEKYLNLCIRLKGTSFLRLFVLLNRLYLILFSGFLYYFFLFFHQLDTFLNFLQSFGGFFIFQLFIIRLYS